MKLKHATMLALLVPAMALVSACNLDTPADDMATPPADTAPVDTTTAPPADATATPPADTTTPAPATDATAGLTFEQMDKNADGGITPDELAPTDMLYEHFAAADADGNGQLSADEIVKHDAAMAAPASPPAQ
jgi:hypothetical protein